MQMNEAIFRKSLGDFLTPRRLLIYLVVVSLPQLMFANLSGEANMFTSLGMGLKTEFIMGFFLIFAFVWVCGVAPAVLSSLMGASFVAQEEADGTLLVLVSKPVRRVDIFLSKFAAFALASLAFAASSLLVSLYIWASAFKLDLYSFFRVLSMFPILLIYCMLVCLLFGSISAAISTMFSSKIKALVPVILVVLLTFFVFIPIRGGARAAGVYQSFMLDAVDLGYDLGNIYIGLLEKTGTRLVPYVQMVVGTFTGTFVVPEGGMLIDYDHGFILPSLKKATYHSLFHSLLKWLVLPALLVVLGLWIFRRRDIN